jgi:hypothetical protein
MEEKKLETERTTPETATQTEQKEQNEPAKKPGWFRRNGKKLLAIAGTVGGITGAIFLGKKYKDYSDQWNAGQAELQGRFPDGEITMTDEDGNTFNCFRQAFFGGKSQKSELLFWADAPDAEDED